MIVAGRQDPLAVGREDGVGGLVLVTSEGPARAVQFPVDDLDQLASTQPDFRVTRFAGLVQSREGRGADLLQALRGRFTLHEVIAAQLLHQPGDLCGVRTRWGGTQEKAQGQDQEHTSQHG